jgi:hypothetical protein
MASQSGLANLKVVGPIDIPNNTESTIHTMERSGLVFVSAVAFANQDLRKEGFVYWRNNADAEPSEYNNFILFGNPSEQTLLTSNFHGAPAFVPSGAAIRQSDMRIGSNYVRVYLYILEFDDDVSNFGNA